MFWLELLFVALAFGATTATPIDASSFENNRDHHFTSHRPKAFAPPAPLKKSTDYVVLQRSAGISASSKHLLQRVGSNSTASLIASDGGTGYAINVNFGGTNVQMLLDTGSSDTWVAQSNLTCVDGYGYVVDTEVCGFGPLYEGSFSDGMIEDQNLNLTYGDGEFITGVMGHSSIGIAGTFIKHQEVALVNFAYWFGDNQTSGLLGFAYLSITAAYEGDDPTQDSRDRQVPYDPIITSAGKQGLFTSYSLAIERGEEGGGGYLALGGLPPVNFDHRFTSTPIEITTAAAAVAGSRLSFYSITPDGIVLGNGGYRAGAYRTNFPVIVDSGTTLNYMPYNLARDINSLFDPPASYIQERGLFEVPCNATAPTLGIIINGNNFYISAQDLILSREQTLDSLTGLCITGIQATFSGPAILGDVFLRNVVAVFDVGASEMRFARHEY